MNHASPLNLVGYQIFQVEKPPERILQESQRQSFWEEKRIEREWGRGGEEGIGHGRWKVSERIRRHAKQIQKIIRQWSRKDTPTLNLDTLMPA